MTPEFAYFLKVNVAFIFLYAFYRLFFYKDTFFKLRRAILLGFFGFSLFYPLLNIQDWVKEQEPIIGVIQMYSAILPETTFVPVTVPDTNWKDLIGKGILFLYWGGVAFLIVRFFIQLTGILLLAGSSRRSRLRGVPVHLLKKPGGPFSFFKLIFIHPQSHSPKEIEEILTHECTHAGQWHSVDVIISELICIFCWVNPFVWLLKREVRHNLEYLADNKVLESGYDCKSYQYHLLGLAHHERLYDTIYNNFNVLHIKNRIRMMNKKRSRGIGRTKYLAFIPVSACLMLLSNIDAVARITAGFSDGEMLEPEGKTVHIHAQVVDEKSEPLQNVTVIVKGLTTGTITDENGFFSLDAPEDARLEISYFGMQKKEIRVASVREGTCISLYTETTNELKQFFSMGEIKKPAFPGGEEALQAYLQQHIRYPYQAHEKGIQGKVRCSFIIDKEGTVRNIQVEKGIEPTLDSEAIRVLSTMPNWLPAEENGKKIAMRYEIPITFRMHAAKKGLNRTLASYADKLLPKEKTVEQIFTVVETPPEFPGGQSALFEFVNRNIKYPVESQAAGEQGRVSCAFVVGSDGTVLDPEVLRGISPALDAEALRIIQSMPKWNPGRQRGRAVPVKYTIPITFRLQ